MSTKSILPASLSRRLSMLTSRMQSGQSPSYSIRMSHSLFVGAAVVGPALHESFTASPV